jgi:hypothetical protein
MWKVNAYKILVRKALGKLPVGKMTLKVDLGKLSPKVWGGG